MRRLHLSIAMLSIAALAGCGDSSQPLAPTAAAPRAPLADAAFTDTQNSSFTVSGSMFVPCANGGAGELVELSGTAHVVDHVTQTANGTFHIHHHENAQGIAGTGLTTGDDYHNVGSVSFHTNLAAGETDDLSVHIQLVGQGPGNNFSIFQVAHLTINANGVVTVDRNDFSVECD